MKDQSSSEPLEEKPFLTEDDGEQEVMKAGYYEQYHKSPGEYFFKGFMCAASKANARISSLESELKALREERDKFAEWYNKLPKDQIVTLMGSAIIYMTPLEELFAKFKAYTLNTEKN